MAAQGAITVGTRVRLRRTFTEEDLRCFGQLTRDYNPVHYEPVDYAPRIGRSKIRPIRDTLRFIQLIARVGVFFAPLRVFLPVAGTDLETVFRTARKITHYGRYGRLSFKDGVNIGKGVGEVSGSPLVVDLESDS